MAHANRDVQRGEKKEEADLGVSLDVGTFVPDGAKETRTPDPYNAIVVLYQLSYSPGMKATIPMLRTACQAWNGPANAVLTVKKSLLYDGAEVNALIVPRVLATGFAVPSRVMTNDELSTMVDTSDEWIYSHTGIRERRIADDGQATSDLAAEACRRALERAGVAAGDVGLILVATSTPDYLGFPATASLVQNALGATRAGAMDVNAACTGFVYALETARAFIIAGTVRYVLVVGAEVFSRIIDWTDRNTCILFGDGAAATLVGPTPAGLPEGWFPPSLLRSDGEGGPALLRPAGGTRQPVARKPSELAVAMDGRRVYSFAITVVKDIVLDILTRNGLTLDDVDWFVPHQANVRIVASAAQRLGVPLDRFYLNMERYANTWGASIPLALAEMEDLGLLERGQIIVTVGFGAGLSWGANLFRW